MEMTSQAQHGGNRSSNSAWEATDSGLSQKIGKASFVDQFKALVIRNLTLKRRNRRHTITEFFMPLYFIMILAIIRVSIKDTTFEEILVPHGQVKVMSNVFSMYNSTIHVAPRSAQAEEIMNKVKELANPVLLNMVYHDSEEALLHAYHLNTSLFLRTVVFSEDPMTNKSYKIRFNPDRLYLASATKLYEDGSQCRGHPNTGLQGFGCAPNSYYNSGFATLQTLIDAAIISVETKSNIKVPDVLLQNFPKDTFTSAGGLVLRNIVPLYMVFAWAQFIVYMMMMVVEEKEKRIKEGMKMMGLRDSVYWLSWFVVYGCYVIVLALICIIVLPLAQVFQHANIGLLFLLFILYGFSSIVLALMMTPFFNRAKVAGIVGNLTQIAFSVLYYLQVYLGEDADPGIFWALGLLSPCAFSLAIDKVILFDITYIYSGGLGVHNLWEGPGLPFAGSLIMISVDIVLYLSLAYYLDNVIPSEFGTKRRPWFIFQKSFWFPRSTSYQFNQLVPMEQCDSEVNEDNNNFEPIPSEFHGKVAVRIRNLRKVFHSRGKEPVTAVDGISLDIYEGQITAILGHNGAGKTTLFNILTGMTAPTEGFASIFGLDISDANDLTDIRRITGVCPQHDIIFLTLTPREHLSFYARIRGIAPDMIESHVEETLQEVDLSSKGDTRASDLSGGQKRKLSIGIALIGDPKIIFLDEPTAGVDAYSRRRLWALLKKRKAGKVILLTTHFMDEADILADRKAIVSKGKLRCCGSSLFLKKKFGLGYHLTLVVTEESIEETITGVLRTIIPEAQLARHYGKEMSYVLPSDSTDKFPRLFSLLDHHVVKADEHIGIETYGISMTTLEEVFLSLSEEHEGGEMKDLENLSHQMIQEKSPSSSPLHNSYSANLNEGNKQTTTNDKEGFAIHTVEVQPDNWRAFKAMMKVRFISFFREVAAVFFMIVFPLGFTIGAIALVNGQSLTLPSATMLHLTPYAYGANLPGALLHNGSKGDLAPLENVFASFGMSTTEYDGSYIEIFNERPHLTALNVTSFPRTGASMATESVNLTLGFNDTYAHSIPILINLISNAMLRTVNASDLIHLTTQLLPGFESNVAFDVSSFFAPMMIGFTYTLIPSALSIEFVQDREIKARYLQRLNGVGFNLYFTPFFLVIGSVYLISYIGLLIIIIAFNVESLVTGPAYASIAVLYFLYMPVALLYSAVVCYMFDKAETARQFYPSIATTIGFLSYTIVSLVDMLVADDGNGYSSAQIVHIVFSIFLPYYIPFGLLYYINDIYLNCTILGSCAELTVRNYMTVEIIVLFVMTIVDIPLYYILLRVVDTLKMGGNWRDALWMKHQPSLTESESAIGSGAVEDDDVRVERAKVFEALQRPDSISPLLIYNLGKIYKKGDEKPKLCRKEKDDSPEFVALKSLSLEIKSGQVFGLLGPNGAGKTTSLRIITAEEGSTSGRIQISGEDVTSGLSKVFETLGYCPQHDCVWRNVTVAEHIEVYCEIRGVKQDQVKQLTDAYLGGLEIDEHKNKKSKDCSGGTKRKLSYIISMLGRPQVVLLDEPSTGMDPKSKRFLWNSILASFKGERSAILTTHSMEEAESLCSRIGILVRGSLRCLGAIQHLKNKYGGGYTLEVKLAQDKPLNIESATVSPHDTGADENVTTKGKIQSIMKEAFPNATVDEEFEERIIYKIPQSDVTSLAECFEMLEKAKAGKMMEEYALSQTTLEQVFLQFARQQENLEEEEESK